MVAVVETSVGPHIRVRGEAQHLRRPEMVGRHEAHKGEQRQPDAPLQPHGEAAERQPIRFGPGALYRETALRDVEENEGEESDEVGANEGH